MAKECVCSSCKSRFCFKCGLDAHAPVPCDLAVSFLQLDQGDALTEVQACFLFFFVVLEFYIFSIFIFNQDFCIPATLIGYVSGVIIF